ncbi:MAG TPA: D-alanyl-D-alanine carboxypeptidase family protein [Thermomicrobiales bacterium]
MPISHSRQTRAGWLVIRAALFSCATLILLPLLSAGAQEVPELRINSKRYIVIDADTGEVFAQRGAHDKVAIASLTKIFTAIEALERGDLDMLITTKPSDVFDPSSSLMGFGPGETFTLRDLLYGLMLPSGNDAAFAIARALGYQEGDTDEEAVARFVGWMNERVRNMGLTETNLVRPDGWGVEGHYSSAHDVAVFTMYALQYPMFRELISTAVYTTSNGAYTLTNTNKLLNSYPYLLGGKTGYDEDAGYCLMEVAQRDGHTMISVTLDGIPDNEDWYDDNRVLLEYAFEQKTERLNANRPITGEIVSFRDPDAARILAMATAGAVLGAPEPTPTPPPTPIPTRPPAPLADSGDGGGNGRLIATILVAGAVIAAGVAGSLFRTRGSPPRATRESPRAEPAEPSESPEPPPPSDAD